MHNRRTGTVRPASRPNSCSQAAKELESCGVLSRHQHHWHEDHERPAHHGLALLTQREESRHHRRRDTILCILIIGIDLFFVMQSLGEMSTLFPIQGAFIELAGRFVDPSLSLSLGWNYFYLWVTNIAGDFNASSIIMGFWTDKVLTYGWILIWWAFYQGTSLLGVVVWGEMEFWLACWKLMCILGGFLCAILINTGAVGGEYIGSSYWKDPGPIANGIEGFGQCFLLAAVYYCGTEMLALTAAESANPSRDLPRAIKRTFWRILIIFLGLVFFVGIIVPSNSPGLLTAATKSGKSPWTIAFRTKLTHVQLKSVTWPSAP